MKIRTQQNGAFFATPEIKATPVVGLSGGTGIFLQLVDKQSNICIIGTTLEELTELLSIARDKLAYANRRYEATLAGQNRFPSNERIRSGRIA